MEERRKQFEEKWYPILFEQALQKLISWNAVQTGEMQLQLLEETKEVLRQLVEGQTKSFGDRFPKIAEITCSFLLTSFWFGEPILQWDAYAEGGRAMTKSIFTKESPAPWFSSILQSMEERLHQEIQKESMVRYLRPVKVSLYSFRALRALLFFLGGRLKYDFTSVPALPYYSELQKESSFVLSFGEYLDWQRPLYAEMPEVTMDQAKGRRPLYFRLFQDQCYEEEEFNGLYLTHSTFRNCVFNKLKIKNCRLLDCEFENCQFRSVQVEESQFFGSRFEQTGFLEVSFSHTWFAVTAMITVEEIYRNVFFVLCQWSHVHFYSCVLNAVRLVNCVGKDITEERSCYIGSDVALWFEKEEAEREIL